MRLRAASIYTTAGWASDHVLEVSDQGTVRSLMPFVGQDVDHNLPGYLIPGWINSHCHLELSALRGDIPRETGMAGFINALFRARAAYSEAELTAAAQAAMHAAHQSGTAFLGDISNFPLTAALKRLPGMLGTHTFVEVLGMQTSEANERLARGQAVAQAFAGLPHSLTPHAPYSVSTRLFEQLYATDGPYSLHLMESAEEEQLFATQDGPLVDFYQKLGLPFSPFAAHDPVSHSTHSLAKAAHILFVHNTRLSPDRLQALGQQFPRAWFVLCPRANAYIHAELPDVAGFAAQTDRLCLGTDSLASNDSLDMWAEVQAILSAFPTLDLHRVIRWATTNGAQALGVGDRVGAFQVGTQPGVLHLTDQDWRKAEVEVLTKGA